MFCRILALAAFSAAALHGQSAPRVAGTLPAAELKALEQVRRDVWLHWFSGDTAGLRKVLAPELVAIDGGSTHWASREEEIAGSAAYAKGGAKLVSITFDSNAVHRFGDVVVMFSHYVLVTERSGTRDTRKGRVTEVFVRSAGRWVHTSWHIDQAGS